MDSGKSVRHGCDMGDNICQGEALLRGGQTCRLTEHVPLLHLEIQDTKEDSMASHHCSISRVVIEFTEFALPRRTRSTGHTSRLIGDML